MIDRDYLFQKINLVFTDFQIENHPSCSWDSLTVYDGASENSPKSVLCGSILPDPVVSSGEVLMLEFKSDHMVSWKGFRVGFSVMKTNETYTKGEIFHLSLQYPR